MMMCAFTTRVNTCMIYLLCLACLFYAWLTAWFLGFSLTNFVKQQINRFNSHRVKPSNHPRHQASSKLLFILKHREADTANPWSYSTCGTPLSSGLMNSASFVVKELMDAGIGAKLVSVIDNNDIDREVTAYKPTHVIIEAYWVVPEKFDVLRKLHPKVTWIVRNHSKSAFLATEGIGFEWSLEYLRRGVCVAMNSEAAFHDFNILALAYGLDMSKVMFLPNIYPAVKQIKNNSKKKSDTLNIGCFGAIRPLKNQLIQAIAAIAYADESKKQLNFHINSNRIEMSGAAVLKNIREIFSKHPRHKLIEHTWLEHDAFLDLIETMDICLQVSYSETFNIVTADAVSRSVPVITSDEVPFLTEYFFANPNDAQNICDKIRAVDRLKEYGFRHRIESQIKGLNDYSATSLRRWQLAFR